MITTIDAAGRLVVPKAVRDAMGLVPGVPVDVVFADGRIEIEFAPAEVVIDTTGSLPRARATSEIPPLTDEQVRAAIDSTRR